MRKTFFLVSILAALVLAACAPAATAIPEPTLDIPATTSALAATMAAGTLAALPTATTAPTETLPPPTETATSLPTETATLVFTETATVTLTPEPFEGTLAPAGTQGTRPSLLRVENNTNYKPLTITLNGVSDPGEKPVYYAWEMPSVGVFEIVWGRYQYYITVGNKLSFSGEFRVNNYDKTTIRVFNNKVVIVGP
jgi:hypothetical protein